MPTALLRLKNPLTEKDGKPLNADMHIRLPLPSGGNLMVSFTKANDYTAEVPTEIKYRDDMGKEKVYMLDERRNTSNLAQHILDSYPDMVEIVEIKNEPVVAQPAVVEKKRGPGRPRKEETQ